MQFFLHHPETASCGHTFRLMTFFESRQPTIHGGRHADLVEHPVDAAMTVKYWAKINELLKVDTSDGPSKGRVPFIRLTDMHAIVDN